MSSVPLSSKHENNTTTTATQLTHDVLFTQGLSIPSITATRSNQKTTRQERKAKKKERRTGRQFEEAEMPAIPDELLHRMLHFPFFEISRANIAFVRNPDWMITESTPISAGATETSPFLDPAQ